jgi:multiple sugar transport system substrate-binding protein
MRGLRLITLAAIPVLAFSACSSTSATTAPSVGTNPTGNTATATAGEVPGKTTVRWFVGLGTGTQAGQIAAQNTFVTNYNKTNTDNINLKLQIVPQSTAYDTLKTEIVGGNAPDIIGPIGVRGRDYFTGLYLDLTNEIAANNYDMSVFDPALTTYVQQGETGIVGIPYDMYPGYLWYNKDIFAAAGLPNLPTKVGDTYQGKTWDFAEMSTIAQQLTVDKNGKKSTDPAFDSANIVKYGLDFQWLGDFKRIGTYFGSGNLVAADGKTAQIPTTWADGFNWYYNAIWTGHFVPGSTAEGSDLLSKGTSQSSGNIAMNLAFAWSMCCIATNSAGVNAVKSWDIAVVPAWNGVTTIPEDIDTFVIWGDTKVADAAFKAMVSIEADSSLMAVYGGEPAETSKQAAYFTSQNANLAKSFPGIQVTWSVLDEDKKYAPAISHEATMPGIAQSWADANAALTKLQGTKGLVVADVLAALKSTLQSDFDNAIPVLNQ